MGFDVGDAMTGLLLALSLAAPPDEIELAKAAAAAELAKLSLKTPDAVAPADPPAPRVTAYADIYARALAGERVTVQVGSYGLDGSPVKIAAGVWEFWVSGDVFLMQRKEVSRPTAVPFPPAGSTRDMIVRPADGNNYGLTGTTPTGLIGIGAPLTGRFGVTSACPPSG